MHAKVLYKFPRPLSRRNFPKALYFPHFFEIVKKNAKKSPHSTHLHAAGRFSFLIYLFIRYFAVNVLAPV